MAIEALIIPGTIWQAMRQHVESLLPEEACGILGGTDRHVKHAIPVANSLHSPYRYRMDPSEQVRAFEALDSQGLELLAIFHSHPNGPDVPSQTDIDEAFYPDQAYLIWFQRQGAWDCRGFTIRQGRVEAIELQIVSAE
jgi:proteasome lid subunit RPN8/RPN11